MIWTVLEATRTMSDRQRLRPWLEARINSGEVPGLRWINKEKTQFRVTWKHAGKPDFDLDRDAVLFRMWAEHTGKYKPGEQPDPSTWKTRFRCALHKMPDIEEIRVPHSLDEREPYRVFLLKPKVPSSPKSKLRTTSSSMAVDTPSPSPPNDYDNGFSYPSGTFIGHNGYIHSNYVPMSYNPSDLCAFPSPLSSHTSSPPHPTDINGNTSSMYTGAEDDIDNIIPTIPPIGIFGSNGHMDNGMDGLCLKPQPIPNVMIEDCFMKPNFTNNFTNNNIHTICYPLSNGENQCEPTFTELQSVRNETMIGYGGGGSGAIMYEGIPFNGMTNNMGNHGQSSLFAAHNGNTFPMSSLQKLLHAGFPLEMVQEMNQMPQVSNAFIGSNPMDNSTSNIYSTTKMPEFQQVPFSSTNGVTLFELEKLTAPKHFRDKTEYIMSVRVFYEDKEAMAFTLSKDERIIRMFHGKQIKQEENTGLCYYDQCSTKQIQLPDLPCSAEVKYVLANFNRGLAVEISNDGNIWAMKLCLTKVFFSCGDGLATKLLQEVKTKVFDFSDELRRESQESKNINCLPPSCDVTFTLGQEPNKPSISVIITHVQAKGRIMGKKSSTQQSISEGIITDR